MPRGSASQFLTPIRQRASEPQWADLRESHLSDAESTYFDELFASLEGRFLMRVYLPCWLTYLMPPSDVLQRAMKGPDIDTIATLLGLDGTLIHHPLLHDLLNGPTSADAWGFLTKPLAGGQPVARAKKVKYRIAAFLWLVADAMALPLSCPDIQSLFDAQARDQGRTRDTDFSATPESFAKGVRRTVLELRKSTGATDTE